MALTSALKPIRLSYPKQTEFFFDYRSSNHISKQKLAQLFLCRQYINRKFTKFAPPHDDRDIFRMSMPQRIFFVRKLVSETNLA